MAHRVQRPATMRPLSVASLVAVPLLLAPALASANEVAVDVNVDVNVQVAPTAAAPEVVIAEPPPPPRRSALRGERWEAGVSVLGGSFELGELSGGQVGVRGFVGRQLGPLRIGVDGSVARWSASMDVYDQDGWWAGWVDLDGEIARVGATARLRGVYAPDDPSCPCDLGLYVEGGLGRSWITASGGSQAVERPDYMLGAGFEVAGGRGTFGGMDLGVRMIASPSVDRHDATHDLAIVGHLGAVFGR